MKSAISLLLLTATVALAEPLKAKRFQLLMGLLNFAHEWATLLQHEDNGGRAEICGRARHRRRRSSEKRNGRKVPRVHGKGQRALREGVKLAKATRWFLQFVRPNAHDPPAKLLKRVLHDFVSLPVSQNFRVPVF